jgi:hypothetical protein
MAASAIIEDLGKKPPVMAMASLSEESPLIVVERDLATAAMWEVVREVPVKSAFR